MKNKLRFLSKYRLLMRDTQEMILFFDHHGKIIECNDRAMKELGYTEDIYRLSISDVFKKAFLSQDKQLKLDPKYKSGPEEAVAYRKNETCFPVNLKITVLNDKKDSIGMCTAFNISDLTEAVRENRSLKNELKNMDCLHMEMIANVTHELKTPINGILGFSNSLMNSQLSSEQLDDLQIIRRCCNNMNTIINDILNFSKLTNTKIELEKRDFNFRQFINQIIVLNTMQINEKGLKLLVDISDEIPEIVTGDEHKLSQILNNLFSNAVKFTSYGHIGIEVSKISQTDDTIELFFIVFDTGIGIGPEEKDKLFKSFSQVDSSITRRFGGTGLGLSICKGLVEAMGGTIQLDSEKDKGSTFTFSIRLGLPKAPAAQQENVTNDLKFETIIDEYDDYQVMENNETNRSITEIEYINMRLQDNTIKGSKKPISNENMKELTAEVKSILEKLVICIEMENWDKAEELATTLKKSLPQDQAEVSKKVFRLLLAIRKENHDSSLLILKELQEDIPKEVSYG